MFAAGSVSRDDDTVFHQKVRESMLEQTGTDAEEAREAEFLAGIHKRKRKTPLGELRQLLEVSKHFSEETITLADMEGLLHLHADGAAPMLQLFERLELKDGDSVIDIGSGLGGSAMLCAAACNVKVYGIERDPQYVKFADSVAEWPLIARAIRGPRNPRDGRAHFIEGDVTEFGDGLLDSSIDAAYMANVGACLEPEVKGAVVAELARVIKTGGFVGVYELVSTDATDELAYPQPFADSAEQAHFLTPAEYAKLFRGGGAFEVVEELPGGRGGELETRQLRTTCASLLRHKVLRSYDDPPPTALALENIMGEDWAEREKNFAYALQMRQLRTHILILRRTDRKLNMCAIQRIT